MIFHITSRDKWQEAIQTGIYLNPSLNDEGFIHCSTPDQILRSANAYYHGQSSLVLLCISPGKVKAPIVYEDSYKKGEQYPHIYGSLNVDAIIQAIDLPTNTDGSFTLPDAIRSQY